MDPLLDLLNSLSTNHSAAYISGEAAFIAFESPPNSRSNLPRFRSLLLLPFGNGPAWDIISVDLKERFAKSEIDKTEFEESADYFGIASVGSS